MISRGDVRVGVDRVATRAEKERLAKQNRPWNGKKSMGTGGSSSGAKSLLTSLQPSHSFLKM